MTDNLCKNCKWRDDREQCTNPKLHDDIGLAESDQLVYIYQEDGGFWVGDDFGCVHFEAGVCPPRESPEMDLDATGWSLVWNARDIA